MTKTIIFIAGLFLFHVSCLAQTTAVTGTGEEVILYDNHTWKYANKSDTEATEIQTNPKAFQKSASSTFKVSSNIVNDVVVCINPKKWTFKKGEAGGAAEYNFRAAGKEEAYGMLIAERVQIPLTNLRALAIRNAEKVAPDIRVVKEEYRKVNGQDVLFMQLEGTASGVKFDYLSYYYSSERGVVQFISYTAQNLLPEARADMEDLLNGFSLTH